MNQKPEKFSIVVVGGCGAFGSFYAKLLAQSGHTVFIKDTSTFAGDELCKKNAIKMFTGDYSQINCILICVPNEVSLTVLKEESKNAKPGTLLVDFCSVKTPISKVYEKINLKNSVKKLELLTVHPMHGPRVDSIAGQPVAWIPIHAGKNTENLKIFFEQHNANLIPATAVEHDKLTALIQGLTHYSLLVTASVLRDFRVDFDKSVKLASPNYSLLLGLISRVATQNPALYAAIQMSNPYNARMRSLFSKNAKKLETICTKKGAAGLTKEILIEAQTFNHEDLLLLESDRAISTLTHNIQKLSRRLHKKILVKNMLTGHYHYGFVQEIKGNVLTLLEGTNEVPLRIQKLHLTTKDERFAWKKKNLQTLDFDFSFLVPLSAKKEVVEKAFGTISDISVTVVDEFHSDKFPPKNKSITIQVLFFGDDDKTRVINEVTSTIEGLGFVFR